MENKVLVVVDMQNDFIDGSLGTKEAQVLVPRLAEYIRNWKGSVILTQDTHRKNYLETLEGRKLPVPHCIYQSEGWQLNEEIADAVEELGDAVICCEPKMTFGDLEMPEHIEEAVGVPDAIEVTGLCTGICVISAVVILRAAFPNMPITVNAAYTECVTPETKKTALEAMKLLQVDVVE